MGGGFGLTKAFYITKQFGGRFFIASECGVGTRIRILLPRPSDAHARPSAQAQEPDTVSKHPPLATATA